MNKTRQVLEERRNTEKVERQEIVNKIREVEKVNLLPNIREKAEEVSTYIVENLQKFSECEGLTSAKVLSLIAKRSLCDNATAWVKTYTSHELSIALTIYINMIDKINDYVKFPPSKASFCQLLGISTNTYNNYLQDPEKCEIMRIIDDYITSNKLTSAEIGELSPIPVMFSLKSQHGFVEAQAPTIIEYKKEININDIQEKLNAMKQSKISEANYEEK